MASRIRNHHLFECLVLFCLSLILFMWGQASREIVGFESRFYLFALEMWQHGANLFPTTYEQPYPDYTATSTFLIYVLAKLFGSMNKLIAIAPSAMAAAFTIVFSYKIAALHSKRWGIVTLFFLLLTTTFLKSARSITLDLYPTLITVCCFYFIYSADLENKQSKAKWIYPFLILGFLFRGPIGLIIPSGVICTYYLLDQQFKKMMTAGFFSLLILICLSVLLLVFAYHVGDVRFMQEVLRMQVIGRMNHSDLPFYFYFVKSVAHYSIAYPLSLMVLFITAYYAWISRDKLPANRCLIKLAGWVIVIMIGMSIPGDKKIRYVLPMAPALALITAYPYALPIKENYFFYLRKILMHIFMYAPSLLVIGSSVIFFYTKKESINIPYFYTISFLILLQLINFWIFYVNFTYSFQELWMLFAATLGVVIFYMAVIEPIALYVDRAHDFIIAIEKKRVLNHAPLVFYKESPDGFAIKYLINMPQMEKPTFISQSDELAHFPDAFFVTRAAYFSELTDKIKSKFKIIASVRLGHIDVVIFTKGRST